jgi:hypothetical protein
MLEKFLQTDVCTAYGIGRILKLKIIEIRVY